MVDGNKTIKCPHCHKSVSLNDALTHEIEEKYRVDYESRLKQDKQKMWQLAQSKALEKIQAEQATEMKALKESLVEKNKLLEEAQRAELEVRRERVKLEEEKKSFELKLARQLDQERSKIQEETSRKISEDYRLKHAENEKKLQDVLKANEELRRKLEQGSQQTQGEVLELELENILKTEFPLDEIVPVSKGISGADVVQKVRDNAGRLAGAIVWESKRTKSWSDGWIQKLKDDQRGVKAEVAVLVSHVLPKELKYFGDHNGIYVCDYQSFVGLAKLLRTTLMQLAAAKLANIGKKEKMEVLWNYLTSVEFRQRMESIVESFTEMKSDLDREKRAYTKIWAKREKQIERVLDNTVGLRGDLEGVMGKALPEMKQLELSNGEADLEQLVEEL